MIKLENLILGIVLIVVLVAALGIPAYTLFSAAFPCYQEAAQAMCEKHGLNQVAAYYRISPEETIVTCFDYKDDKHVTETFYLPIKTNKECADKTWMIK